MTKKTDLNKIQDLWNCGYSDKQILDSLEGDLNLKDIKKAREELGLSKNRKKRE